ncbi:MAG: hypothetical protein IJ043_05020 [Clostridia bacterium]|nr:hypothetical protein [Clostridia bacterium]
MKRTKRLWSMLLAVVMLLGLLPMAKVEAEDVIYFNTWVAGVQITSENMNNVAGGGTVIYTPAQGNAPARLTLNGANIQGSSAGLGNYGAIESEEVLIIEIKGNNTLTSENYMGIRTSEALYLQSDGTGSLTVSCGRYCIWSQKKAIAISGLKELRLSNTVSDFHAVYGLDGLTVSDCDTVISNNSFSSGNGDMLLQNGCFQLTEQRPYESGSKKDYVLHSLGALTIRNAQVEINSFDESTKNNYSGIYGQMGVTISAGSTVSIADAKRGIRGSRDVEISSSNVSVAASEHVIQSNTNVIALTNCAINEDKTPVKILEGDVVNTADGEIATAVEIKQTSALAKHKVTVTVNDPTLGNVLALGLNDEGKITEGAAVTLRATPTPGKRFVGWKSGEEYISSDSECSVIITEETNIVAEFAKGLIYDTWVGGVQVTSDNKDDVLGNGTVAYIPSAGTTPAALILIDAQITLDSTLRAAIETEETLTVTVFGSSSVKSTCTSGIYSTKALFLQGNGAGSLSVESCSQGIYSRLSTVQISGFKELSIKSGVNHSLGAEMPAIYAFCGMTVKDCALLTANNTLYSGNGGDAVQDVTIDNSTVKINLPKADTKRYGIDTYAGLKIINGSYVSIEGADADAKNAYNGIFSQKEMFITDSYVSVKDSVVGILCRKTIEITRSRVYVTASVTNVKANGDENDPNVYYIKLNECALTRSYIKLSTTVDERDGWGDYTTVVSSDGSFATTVAIGMPLTEIEIQGLTPPSGGVALDKAGIHMGDTAESASYRISNRTWYDVTDGKSMNNGDVFQVGHTYRYKALIVMKEDGCDSFPASADEISVSLAGIPGEYTIEKKFNSSNTIFTCDIYFECAREKPDTTVSRPAGSGTANDPFQIGTIGELYWFTGFTNNYVAVGEEFAVERNEAHAILMNDITVNPALLTEEYGLNVNSSLIAEWTPICHLQDAPFCGTFDGQNHTVSGLYYYTKGYQFDYYGFIARMGEGGAIKDLTLKDTYFYTEFTGNGTPYAAGIVAFAPEGSNGIENCHFDGVVGTESYSRGGIAGGIAGANYGTIKNCTVKGRVIGADSYGATAGKAGGIVGTAGTTAAISDCTNYAEVTCWDSGTGVGYAGGIAGYFAGTVKDCSNRGVIYGQNVNNRNYAGGIVGWANGTAEQRVVISRCRNEASFTGSGIVDFIYRDGTYYAGYATVKNCYNTGGVTNGIVGTAKGAEISVTYCHNVGNATQPIIGSVINASDIEIASCYYLAESDTDGVDGTTAMDAERFSRQDIQFVTKLLNANNYGQWKQGESYPVLAAVATLSGRVTGFGLAESTTTVQLIPEGASKPAYEVVVTGNSAAYTAEDVAEGRYTLRATKLGHLIYEAPLTVEGTSMTCDITLERGGDVDESGETTVADLTLLLQLLTGASAEADRTAADLNGDASLSIADAVILARVLAE